MIKVRHKKQNTEQKNLKKEKVKISKAQKKEESQRKKRIKSASDTLELIPIINYDDIQGCFITKDNKYIDIIQVISKDLTNVGQDVANHDAMIFEKMYKTYGDDIKIIFTNYPTDVSRQIRYFNHRIDNTINPVFLQYLREKKAELEYLEKHRSSREFFIMMFSDSLEKCIKNTNSMKGALGYLAKEVDMEKKIRILHKLANKNIQTF